jgi:hypothetical protein
MDMKIILSRKYETILAEIRSVSKIKAFPLRGRWLSEAKPDEVATKDC